MNDQQANEVLLEICDLVVQLMTKLPGDCKFNNQAWEAAFQDHWNAIAECQACLKNLVKNIDHCINGDHIHKLKQVVDGNQVEVI